METIILFITTAPGYVCRKGRVQHEELYKMRYKMLYDIEAGLERGAEDAAPLLNNRSSLLAVYNHIQLQRYLQTAVRITVCPISFHNGHNNSQNAVLCPLTVHCCHTVLSPHIRYHHRRRVRRLLCTPRYRGVYTARDSGNTPRDDRARRRARRESPS